MFISSFRCIYWHKRLGLQSMVGVTYSWLPFIRLTDFHGFCSLGRGCHNVHTWEHLPCIAVLKSRHRTATVSRSLNGGSSTVGCKNCKWWQFYGHFLEFWPNLVVTAIGLITMAKFGVMLTLKVSGYFQNDLPPHRTKIHHFTMVC